MWANICRVCSSRADYDIFSKIPAYLHATSNEFINWQQQINVLLEETTGLTIDPEDGLPTKICALCISYLKHAVTFRQQAINNTLSLKAITLLSTGKKPNKEKSKTKKSNIICDEETLATDEDKDSVLVTADDLIFNENRKTDTNILINTFNNNNNKVMRCKSLEYAKNLLLLNETTTETSTSTSSTKNQQQDLINNCLNVKDNDVADGEVIDKKVLTTYLNLLFDKSKHASISPELDESKFKAATAAATNSRRSEELGIGDPFDEESPQSAQSSEETEACETKENFFSYKEKNFEEDDIMELDELKDANISINIPEICKERKCRACFRRFMLEESYNEHIDTCIEYKFLTLIEELNRLLEIRRRKAISPHEFIRRIIFCLRKTSIWLNTTCGEMLLPDLLVNKDNEKRGRYEGGIGDGKSTATRNTNSNGDDDDDGVEDAGKQSDGKNIYENLSCHREEIIDERKNSLLELLRTTADSSFQFFPQQKAVIDDNTNILTLIENEEKSGSQIDDEETKMPTMNTFDNDMDPNQMQYHFINEDHFNFLQKLNNATKENSPSTSAAAAAVTAATDCVQHPSTLGHMNSSNPVFSARCNTCCILFESVASLEEHNANVHNATTRWEQHKKIIALFEDDDDDDDELGSVV